MNLIKLGIAVICLGFTSCQAMDQLNGFFHSASKPSTPSTPLSAERAHAQILSEMLRVVFREEPSRARLVSLSDIWSQGASLEGIYNGLTHSSDYRRYEFGHPGNSKAALDYFSQTLSWVEKQISPPGEITVATASPIALPLDLSDPGAAPAPVKLLLIDPAVYSGTFAQSSIYTLKRVLSDEFLRLVDLKKASPGFARWYAEAVVRTNALKIDFGLSLRNSGDVQFYETWAGSASDDQIKWEILNRIHRILNSTQKEVP